MRLTKKIDNYYHIIHNWSARNTFEDQNKEDFAINKLGQLEDIEEELGIDLITLFKILKRKIIYRVNDYDKKIQQMVMYGECDLTGILVYEKGFEYPECARHLLYKDYGKAFALTKEELE